MKTETVIITSRGSGMAEALLATEKLGADNGLAKKEKLRLRLLSEELIGLMRGIAGDVEALYWVEQAEKKYELHLKANVPMAPEIRRQLLAASSSGKNAAARGFMGKLREMIAFLTLSDEQSALASASMDLMSMGGPAGYDAGLTSYIWSLNCYKAGVRRRMAEGGAAENDWEVLERSIVANLSDEVIVRIVGSEAEIIIAKTF